jgi:hypothetical protein
LREAIQQNFNKANPLATAIALGSKIPKLGEFKENKLVYILSKFTGYG